MSPEGEGGFDHALALENGEYEDGRIPINLRAKQDQRLPPLPTPGPSHYEDSTDTVPPLSLLILVTGSRGDVQPFLAYGQALQKAGHRVRLGTHETFRQFVLDARLEFAAIGGDPRELMSYMVRNPGLMPSVKAMREGEIQAKTKMVGEILDGCWAAAYTPDDATGRDFICDAIIANPPSFAHIHIAEKLGIPCHVVFTMPWSPTREFQHPLTALGTSTVAPELSRYLSWTAVELLTWKGLSGVTNTFRSQRLRMRPLTTSSGAGVLHRLRVPHTYCWSPALIPKPRDWPSHIDCCGFFFLPLASSYTPPQDLIDFLAAGEKPIYVGFGSIPVEDPAKMTAIIFEAVKAAGVRALVSAGWGDLGAGDEVPEGIKLIGNVPHDWLFQHVSAVCQHGGAGTTSQALKLGRPTIVVPFFADQPFWGEIVARAGAGPVPIPAKLLDAKRLETAIRFCMTPEVQERAATYGAQISEENGPSNAVKSFHRQLPLSNMRCDALPHLAAVWWSKHFSLRLSALAAQVLAEAGVLDHNELQLHRPKEHDTRKPETDPVTGAATSFTRLVIDHQMAHLQLFMHPGLALLKICFIVPLKGLVDVFRSISEGFRNMPALLGGTVRSPGPIDGIGTGLKEAGKNFIFTFSDAILGLYQEPREGYRRAGFVGLLAGVGKAVLYVTFMPVNALLGTVEHTYTGIEQSVKKLYERDDTGRYGIRCRQGFDAAAEATEEEKRTILDAFKQLQTTTQERQQARKLAKKEAARRDPPKVKEPKFKVSLTRKLKRKRRVEVKEDEVALRPTVYNDSMQ